MQRKKSLVLCFALALCAGALCTAGCQDKGNEPVADKSSYTAPKESMQRTYGGGNPAQAAQGGAAAPGAAPAAPPK